MADYESKAHDYRAANVRILAASVDTEDNARTSVTELNLSYPVGFGLVAEQISSMTGAYYEPDRKFLHATGFILKPDVSVASAVYSTGPIGRLMAADTLAVVNFLSKK